MALEQYNKAIELDSKYLRAYINRGRVYAILNRWNEAFADYNEAIGVLGDVNPETYLGRGLIRSELGDKLGAINDLQQAQRGFFEQKDLEGQEKATNFLQQIQE
ncbi:MAG: hypothetical protein QNJ72_08210 [Pleurocapsa sp. MO_226.B13]|nr:hypothetical protein [Pleurocapsa sp. MO_226.B13]